MRTRDEDDDDAEASSLTVAAASRSFSRRAQAGPRTWDRAQWTTISVAPAALADLWESVGKGEA